MLLVLLLSLTLGGPPCSNREPSVGDATLVVDAQVAQALVAKVPLALARRRGRIREFTRVGLALIKSVPAGCRLEAVCGTLM